MARSRLATVWLPVFAWAAVIFAFSSIPHLSSGLGVWDTVLRKGAFAATDELHQHFVRGRHASPIDVGIDAVGVALGMLFWLRVRQR